MAGNTLSPEMIAALLKRDKTSGGESTSSPAPPEGLTWCEFCKGFYLPEYHYGRDEDGDDI